MRDDSSQQLSLLSPDPTESQGVGKDEMNLAEFPFAVLSKRVADGQKTIEVVQEGRDIQGRPVQQEWLVTGSDRFGLPVASDDEVYVALMKLLRDSHFASRTVRFTVAQLLRIMRSGVGKRDYERVEQALDRLTGVLLRSKNAFWSHATKRHVTEAFHLLDSYRLARGVGRELSEVTFSEFLFSSIQSGYVKNLNIDFYFSLSTPLARRYYRLLDKHRYRGRHYEIEILRLAQKLPLQDVYLSQLRRRLDPVHEELIRCGFLEAAEYRKTASGATVVCLQFAARSALGIPTAEPGEAEQAEATDSPTEAMITSSDSVSREAGRQEQEALEAKLTAAGVTRKVAADLVQTYPAVEIERQLTYLPYVAEVKNPGGYLRQAIAQGYSPPPGWTAAQEKENRRTKRQTRGRDIPVQTSLLPETDASEKSAEEPPTALAAAIAKLQSDPEAWEQVLEASRQRLPKILRTRPQNPAYAPSLQSCIEAEVAARLESSGTDEAAEPKVSEKRKGSNLTEDVAPTE